MTANYRSQFLSATSASKYDEMQYGPHAWSTTLWESEQDYLRELLARPHFVPRRENYLDFACGTGRLLSLVAPAFSKAAGLDVSQEMLTRAASKQQAVQLYCRDVGVDPSPLEEPVDLVTVFRFVLNADPDDRTAALRWLRRQLRDDQSRVVLNNHGNLWSHKLVPYLLRRMLSRHPRVTGNLMSGRALERMLASAGFRVVGRRGFGFLGAHIANTLGAARSRRLQRFMNRIPFVDRFAEDQVYVLAPD
jgi:SAM-dependent methyltransferase